MDFTSTTAQLTFTNSSMELCSNITIEDEVIIEEQREQFGLMLFTSDSSVQFSRETASVTIIDDDSMCAWGLGKIHDQKLTCFLIIR